MALSEHQRGALNRAKLTSLLKGGGVVDVEPELFGTFAAAIKNGVGYVLVDPVGPRSLGPTLLWAQRNNVESLQLLCEGSAELCGDIARRAIPFAFPVVVHRIDGTTYKKIEPRGYQQTASVRESTLTPNQLSAFEGLDIVVEDGITKGEYLGLEIARLQNGAVVNGVGRFDREAASMMHHHLQADESVARTLEVVKQYRYVGAPRHPLRDMCLSKWMRTAAVGAHQFVELTMAVDNLKENVPAVAYDSDQHEFVGWSAHVDLDAIVQVADVRQCVAPTAEIIMYEIDTQYDVGLNSLLAEPATLRDAALPYAVA